MVDFRLECSWVEGELVGRPDDARVECDSEAKFVDIAPTPEALAQVQTQVLDDKEALSTTISDQVGRPVQVLEVIVEVPVQPRENGDEVENVDTIKASCYSMRLLPVSLLVAFVAVLVGL